ncbi:bactofilin family protein [Treponema brennaborense]|uniref:Cell shape determination protein CcmA n=1 Tax=Treponema brennaborense (strain DSM 12168 / CIP 105900 / DD5/3) TaxID=906968 RepID=F4LM85_TREBD|nr:polymer-forming cytoskeletal protein [Treponema brennaborense]AEE17751.1 protein of unknown function DUF583 [Treponema brennaborense DSM 12168]
MAFQNDDISINTFIGAGSAVAGDMRISGFIRIDGDIAGNLETTGKVIIGEKARVKGNITAKSAIIGGIVEGNVTAPERIQLFETAAVIGDIATKRLEIADNVVFHGHCISLADQNEYETAERRWLDITALRVNPLMQRETAANAEY